jgi:hypothetical protein
MILRESKIEMSTHQLLSIEKKTNQDTNRK